MSTEEFLVQRGWTSLNKHVDTLYQGEGNEPYKVELESYDASGQVWQRNQEIAARFLDIDRGWNEYVFGPAAEALMKDIQDFNEQE